MPPIRKLGFLTESQLDQALEKLHHAKFPMYRAKVYDLVGLSKKQQENARGFLNNGIASVTYQLTNDLSIHILELRSNRATPISAGKSHPLDLFPRE